MIPFFAHKPKSMKEFIGQDKAIEKIESFLKNFKKGKGLVLYGPPGTGKTSSIYAYAKENKIELLELNASDGRNKKDLEEFLSKATGQMSLFATKKIILLDEIDGLSGMKDRGATTTIAKFIKKSTFPFIMTGINVFDKKYAPVKKESTMVEFKQLGSNDLVEIMKNSLVETKIDVDESSLKLISRQASGDARAALNDLFTFVMVKNSDVEDLGIRKQTEEIASSLIRVFKSTNPEVVFGAYDNINEDLDKIFLWVDENLPKEYTKGKDLAAAYDVLSLADRFYGRIRRWQYYRFYVYCYLLLSVGVALSKDEKYKTPPIYKQPSRLLKYWQANMTYAKRKAIVEKIASAQKMSYKNALKNFPNILPTLAVDKNVQEELELTSDEIIWIKKHNPKLN